LGTSKSIPVEDAHGNNPVYVEYIMGQRRDTLVLRAASIARMRDAERPSAPVVSRRASGGPLILQRVYIDPTIDPVRAVGIVEEQHHNGK
jgi:hypothetical protein